MPVDERAGPSTRSGAMKIELYEHPELISQWHALRDVRAQSRAVDWLLEPGLIDEKAAEKFATEHPEPALP